MREDAVLKRRLLAVADDRVVVLVLEVEQEHVVEAGDVRGRRTQRPRAASRGGQAEGDVIGDRPVVADKRGVRPVGVRERGDESQGDLGPSRASRKHAARHPQGQGATAGAHRADRAATDDASGRRAQRHRHRRRAGRRSPEPGGDAVSGARRLGPAARGAQRHDLREPAAAAGAAHEQLASLAVRSRREAAGAVANDGRQPGGDPPARDRHRVPALDGERPGLRARVGQQVGAGGTRGRGGRASRRDNRRPNHQRADHTPQQAHASHKLNHGSAYSAGCARRNLRSALRQPQ